MRQFTSRVWRKAETKQQRQVPEMIIFFSHVQIKSQISEVEF